MTERIWIPLMTIVRKEVTRFLRIWVQTLIPPVINQSLYFIIFGGFIGSQISDIYGVRYMAFIVPGLIMMAVINSSFSNVVSSFFGAKFQRNIEELMVSPTPEWVILLGYTLGGVLRGLLVGLIILGVSMIFVSIPFAHPFLILAFAVLTALTFSLAGFLNALHATKFDDVSFFPTFVLTPLSYFGGVFYSIQSLPPFWQALSRFNPMLYMIDGFRYGFFGQADVNAWVSLAFLTGFTILLWTVNWWMLKRGTGLRS